MRTLNAAQHESSGSIGATRILDLDSPSVGAFVAELGAETSDRDLLLRAHALVAGRVRPVYALNELQPVSRTLDLGRGSCSQRLAVLEAVARSARIPTCVRGILVDGRLWYPRFPRLRALVPDTVVLAWPEFLIDEIWLSTSELFGPLRESDSDDPFDNAGSETLFDAVPRRVIDWDGVTRCDLSGYVRRDLGHFDSRDQLFALHGQTLRLPARALARPILAVSRRRP